MPPPADMRPPAPMIARVLDVLRGGHTHYGPDRAMAGEVDRQFPGARKALGAEVDFTLRAGCWAAERGISRLVHAGAASYLPGRNLHDAAQSVIPGARVLYVNRQPEMHDDAAALLGSLPGCQAARGDSMRLMGIPEAAAMAAEGEPLCVVYSLVLSYVTGREAATALASLARPATAPVPPSRRGLPPGSVVALSVILPGDGPRGDQVIAAALPARLARRTREDVAGWLGGMDLIAGVAAVRLVPGLEWAEGEQPRRDAEGGQPRQKAEIVAAVARVR